MTSAQRVLLLAGIALAFFGMTYGLWYAVFAEHQALDSIGASLTGSFSAAANRSQTQSAVAMAQYRQAKYKYDRQVDAHGHWIGLSMVMLVLAIAFNYVSFSDKHKLWLAWSLVAGSVLFPSGVLLETLSGGFVPKLIAALGSALVIAALAAIIGGLLRRPAPA
jgi:hypothetical protein